MIFEPMGSGMEAAERSIVEMESETQVFAVDLQGEIVRDITEVAQRWLTAHGFSEPQG